jgi:hypothetical protein
MYYGTGFFPPHILQSWCYVHNLLLKWGAPHGLQVGCGRTVQLHFILCVSYINSDLWTQNIYLVCLGLLLAVCWYLKFQWGWAFWTSCSQRPIAGLEERFLRMAKYGHTTSSSDAQLRRPLRCLHFRLFHLCNIDLWNSMLGRSTPRCKTT